MKRFLALLLICLLIAPCAFAATLNDYEDYSVVLGGSVLKDGDARGDFIRFIQDGCTITIKRDSEEIIMIVIEGKGDPFLSYCSAALAVFDNEGKTNCLGQLLTMYLLSPGKTDHQTGQTSKGDFFFLENKDDGLYFSIMK